MSNEDHISKHLFDVRFKWAFLHPRYWGVWLGMLFAALLAFMPVRLRDRLASFLSTLVVKKNGRVVKRTRINLEYCFPDKSPQEIDRILAGTFAKAAQYLLGYSEFLVRSTKHNQSRGVMIGEENLFPLLESGERVIILAPHAWAVDYPAVMLAAQGYKVANIMKPQKNPIGAWLMHIQRMQYGGRIFSREAGIKPFIRSIHEGYIGYWLPDEDHGPKKSVFVPFFGTEKATLKGFGKMARVCRAKVVPMLPAYNDHTGKYEVHILPALENFPTGDEELDARAMNKVIEDLITDRPEQYMWNLYLLKTQRDGSKIYKSTNSK